MTGVDPVLGTLTLFSEVSLACLIYTIIYTMIQRMISINN